MHDIFASACLGIVQTLIGHPFDTAKVLAQNNKKWMGLPFSHYYRGWRYPLLTGTTYNSITFPIYERSLHITQNGTLSGCLAGIIAAPAVFCFEVCTIYRQTGQTLQIHNIIRSKGFTFTFLRETGAMSVFFGTYSYLKHKNLNTAISGGLAGLANWTLTYPIDVIKSRQIAQQLTIKQAFMFGNLWRGYPICAVRAVLINSINFSIYEFVREIQL